ncbi:MAG: SpoIIE family protein phosphatase [Leptospiraceae bacterium]|nr:SpoIIE family protein phosphatase [Leptospiraceae bacterium]MDW8306560.1 SpoIIE family protein phosphatase [Leptospiraceae bacterium]
MRVRTRLIISLTLILCLAIIPLSLYLIHKFEDAILARAVEKGLAESSFLARSVLNLLLTNGGNLAATRVDGKEILKIFEGRQKEELSFILAVFLSREKSQDRFILVKWPGQNEPFFYDPLPTEGFYQGPCRQNQEETCLVFTATAGISLDSPSVLAILEFSQATILKPVQQLKQSLLYSMLVALLAVMVVGIFLNLQMMKPLRELEKATQELAGGNLNYEIKTNRKDEFGKLAQSFNSMRQALQDYIAKLDEKYKELSAAQSIQQALLPVELPQIEGYAIAARYAPMDQVGGDIYDVMSTPHGFAVLVIDVSGHGVPAALITGMAKMVFVSRPELLERPAEMLSHLNEIFVGQIGTRFLTVVYGVFLLEKKKLIFANGGHPDIIVQNKKTGEIARLNARGGMVGSFRQMVYDQGEVNLSSGQRILFLTDGILECSSSDGRLYEEARLHDFLCKHAHLSVEETCERLMLDIQEFHRSQTSLEDDATVVMVDVL